MKNLTNGVHLVQEAEKKKADEIIQEKSQFFQGARRSAKDRVVQYMQEDEAIFVRKAVATLSVLILKMYKGREDITCRSEERGEAYKEGKSAWINCRFADELLSNSQRTSSNAGNAARNEGSGPDVQIQPEGASHKQKTHNTVRKVYGLWITVGGNQANEVCHSSCLGPKFDT